MVFCWMMGILNLRPDVLTTDGLPNVVITAYSSSCSWYTEPKPSAPTSTSTAAAVTIVRGRVFFPSPPSFLRVVPSTMSTAAAARTRMSVIRLMGFSFLYAAENVYSAV